MFAFCVAITIAGLVLFIASLIVLVINWDPLWLWIVGAIIGAAMMVIGSACGIYYYFSEPNNTEIPDIQQEHTEIVNQYNYCPYCGKEIR